MLTEIEQREINPRRKLVDFSEIIGSIVPLNKIDDFDRLNPARKMIILYYYQVHSGYPVSPHQIIPKIAEQLHYKIDVNGTNTFLLEVIV